MHISRPGWFRPALAAAAAAGALLGLSAQAQAQTQPQPQSATPPSYDFAFERDLFKRRFEQEVQFRAAAIHVAWAADSLCHSTTQIEPFVLLSTHALRRRLSAKEAELFHTVTGMDDRWRVVWLDESAPEEMKIGDAVVSINDRKLPGGSTRVEFSALFAGGSMVANDDQGFWDVMLQARKDAQEGKPFTVKLEDGRQFTVETQTGCAGSVTASAWDADADIFWRLGNQRVKIPANAMIEARDRDELRWLAAFGTYFQASQKAIDLVQRMQGVSTGFTVGRILALAVPGAGMALAAAEVNAERQIVVEGIVGSADLFANEVVAALGGDPGAGLRLSERMLAQGMKVDVVLMNEARRAASAEHTKRIHQLQAAEAEADKREAERREQAQREAQRQPLRLTK